MLLRAAIIDKEVPKLKLFSKVTPQMVAQWMAIVVNKEPWFFIQIEDGRHGDLPCVWDMIKLLEDKNKSLLGELSQETLEKCVEKTLDWKNIYFNFEQDDIKLQMLHQVFSTVERLAFRCSSSTPLPNQMVWESLRDTTAAAIKDLSDKIDQRNNQEAEKVFNELFPNRDTSSGWGKFHERLRKEVFWQRIRPRGFD